MCSNTGTTIDGKNPPHSSNSAIAPLPNPNLQSSRGIRTKSLALSPLEWYITPSLQTNQLTAKITTLDAQVLNPETKLCISGGEQPMRLEKLP